MQIEAERCYQALRCHDLRFDGTFFVGVSTTGIYCRPICRARTARFENCAFFSTAAAAECAGFRPCLRCRPELAPGNSLIDAVSRTAAKIASRVEDGALSEGGTHSLARELGISERHLRRVTQKEFGVSPVQLAQTHRLLLAKRLLTDTNLPIGEIAFASGFNSLRRFNSLFVERYHLNPTKLRCSHQTDGPEAELVCDLTYLPPLDMASLLSFLGARAAARVESAGADGYRRTVAVGKCRGWVTAKLLPGRSVLQVTLSHSLAPVLPSVLAKIKQLFDLNADPLPIAARLGVLAACNPGLRVPGTFDGFELCVRAVLGQQVSVQAASTLAGRFSTAFGEDIKTPYPDLSLLSPTPERIAKLGLEEITQLGITRTRAVSIQALARALIDGKIVLEIRADVEATMAALLGVPGVGEWIAQYIAMRALSWPDAFPHTDLAIVRALAVDGPAGALRAAEQWRPWRAYAAMHLWYRYAKGRQNDIQHRIQ